MPETIFKSIRSSGFINNNGLSKATALLRKVFKWSWISILLLGFTSNLLVNVVLDLKYQRPLVSFSLEETINGIIAAFILLKCTRWLTKKLNTQAPWERDAKKRLMLQSATALLLIAFVLNALLISVTYFFYGGFYEFGDLIVINIIVISLTLFVSFIDISIYFFNTSNSASKADQMFAENPIAISLGKVRHLVQQKDIQYITTNSKMVFVNTSDNRNLPYSESLEHLMKMLNPYCFFRANRQTILTHPVIKSMKSLSHGKIEVTLSSIIDKPMAPIVISRSRAAAFRQWVKSQPGIPKS